VARWHILIVDDNAVIAEQTANLLGFDAESSGELVVEADFETSFDRALVLLEQQHYDLLVLDVRDQSRTGEPQPTRTDTGTEVTDADTGLYVFDEVRRRRFVPIIFFTALPNLVKGLIQPPFVALVSKIDDDSTAVLRRTVRSVLDSSLPAINRGLLDHVGEIVRVFMADFVELHWTNLTSPSRKGDLAYLLLRRLALSLVADGEGFAKRLADEAGVDLALDKVHPMRFYIVPPVGSWTTGDLIAGPMIRPTAHPYSGNANVSIPNQDTPEPVPDDTPEAQEGWYVILTPACDLVPTRVKADYVILAECTLLSEADEFKAWIGGPEPQGAIPSRAAEGRLRDLMLNKAGPGHPQDRNAYLPAAWNIPDLVVDFQRIAFLPYAEIGLYSREATLDSPYAEWLTAKFGRYLGRLGTPDLDVEVALSRLRDAEADTSQRGGTTEQTLQGDR
jgi:CheY-like chemotaxis protein